MLIEFFKKEVMEDKNHSLEALRIFVGEYLIARKKFIDIAKTTNYLKGNDNMIGRIGEFVAMQYLEETNRNPIRPKSMSNPGFDFECDNGMRKIQVKTMTHESKYKQSTSLKGEWDEVIILYISDNLKVEKMGHLTRDRLLEAVNNPKEKFKSKSPQVTLRMLGENGIISKYGAFIDGNKYL